MRFKRGDFVKYRSYRGRVLHSRNNEMGKYYVIVSPEGVKTSIMENPGLIEDKNRTILFRLKGDVQI